MISLTECSYSEIHPPMFCGVGELSKDARNASFNKTVN